MFNSWHSIATGKRDGWVWPIGRKLAAMVVVAGLGSERGGWPDGMAMRLGSAGGKHAEKLG